MCLHFEQRWISAPACSSYFRQGSTCGCLLAVTVNSHAAQVFVGFCFGWCAAQQADGSRGLAWNRGFASVHVIGDARLGNNSFLLRHTLRFMYGCRAE